MQILIGGSDLPGSSCGPGPDFPDDKGQPLCASVQPPRIAWSAGA